MSEMSCLAVLKMCENVSVAFETSCTQTDRQTDVDEYNTFVISLSEEMDRISYKSLSSADLLTLCVIL